MLTLITGAPGSGKSAALVSLISELGKDRPLFVNGIPDLKIPHTNLTDDEVLSWTQTVPDGAIVVIDEVQRVWRPRGPGAKVPESVAGLETHRHRGLDFYVITQGSNLVDSNVRALVGRHVHLRDLGILGRWWYEWPECCDSHRTGWKNAPIKKRYRLPKHIFDKYKSASLHVKPVRSVPWMLAVMVGALVGVGFLSWQAYGMIQQRMNPVMAKPAIEGIPSATAQSPQVAASGAVVTQQARPFIDDLTAWVPRLGKRPESAPAFDHLRVVANMPVVVGGACSKTKGCVCYTQQGTDAGLTHDECREVVNRPQFDPYPPRIEVRTTSGASS